MCIRDSFPPLVFLAGSPVSFKIVKLFLIPGITCKCYLFVNCNILGSYFLNTVLLTLVSKVASPMFGDHKRG